MSVKPATPTYHVEYRDRVTDEIQYEIDVDSLDEAALILGPNTQYMRVTVNDQEA